MWRAREGKWASPMAVFLHVIQICLPIFPSGNCISLKLNRFRPGANKNWMAKGTVPICIGLYITSDQIIIFQQARFPQDRWMSIRIHQHLGEVAIVRPNKTGRTLESPHMAGHAGPLSLDPVRMVPGRVPYFFKGRNEAWSLWQISRWS